ncbi:hypothetical protein ACLOJK_023822, partial [Asimina triloba]
DGMGDFLETHKCCDLTDRPGPDSPTSRNSWDLLAYSCLRPTRTSDSGSSHQIRPCCSSCSCRDPIYFHAIALTRFRQVPT